MTIVIGRREIAAQHPLDFASALCYSVSTSRIYVQFGWCEDLCRRYRRKGTPPVDEQVYMEKLAKLSKEQQKEQLILALQLLIRALRPEPTPRCRKRRMRRK